MKHLTKLPPNKQAIILAAAVTGILLLTGCGQKVYTEECPKSKFYNISVGLNYNTCQIVYYREVNPEMYNLIMAQHEERSLKTYSY